MEVDPPVPDPNIGTEYTNNMALCNYVPTCVGFAFFGQINSVQYLNLIINARIKMI